MLDEADYYNLNDYKWVISGNGTKFYAVRMVKKGPGKTRIEYLHRVIMQPGEGLLVDHRNRNTFDNRRDNLRLATHSENSCNKPKRKNTSSQYIGVTLDKRCGRWEAAIVVHGKRSRLGRFDNEIDAARAYDEAARKYHGEFAKLNFGNPQAGLDLPPADSPRKAGLRYAAKSNQDAGGLRFATRG